MVEKKRKNCKNRCQASIFIVPNFSFHFLWFSLSFYSLPCMYLYVKKKILEAPKIPLYTRNKETEIVLKLSICVGFEGIEILNE